MNWDALGRVFNVAVAAILAFYVVASGQRWWLQLIVCLLAFSVIYDTAMRLRD